MKTKQSVRLISASPLWLVSKGIRYSHNTHDKSDTSDTTACPKCGGDMKRYYSDECPVIICEKCHYLQIGLTPLGPKDFALIKRVGFKHKHESVLEFAQLVFHVDMTQKALLEESRHRIAISQTVTSSRYALNKIDIKLDTSYDKEIDEDLNIIKQMITKHLNNNKPLDKVSKLLPQAFIYTMQLQFNLRSLLNFLRLRLAKDAHIDIRLVAYMIFSSLTDEYQELILCDEVIKSHIDKIKDENLKQYINPEKDSL